MKILCLIGEAFDEHSDDVCGAVVNIRPKGDKLSIWTANSKNKDGILKIGLKLKERLGIQPKSTIVYESHNDSMNKSGSVAKFRFTVWWLKGPTKNLIQEKIIFCEFRFF